MAHDSLPVDVNNTAALAEFVADRTWYHTIDLGDGLVTPGWFDTRALVSKLPFPERLDGHRCLDVGTFDGFWAFEMEARGATDVVATDVLDPSEWDWPVGASSALRRQIGERHDGGVGFDVAAAALRSNVHRQGCNVYELDSDTIGTFDFVYLGSLLVHLRDPIGALERVRAVCRGRLLLTATIDLALTLRSPQKPLARLDGRGRPWWWTANSAGVARMVEAAGFELETPVQRVGFPPGSGQGRPPLRPRVLRSRAGREALLRTRHGDPHVALTARPRS